MIAFLIATGVTFYIGLFILSTYLITRGGREKYYGWPLFAVFVWIFIFSLTKLAGA